MNAPRKVPAFRIEVGDPDKAIWHPIEFAHTEAQRDGKLARRQKEFGDERARAVPNGATSDRKLFLELVDVAALNLVRNLVDFVKSEKLDAKFSEIYGVNLETIPSADEMLVQFGKLLDGELPPGFPVAPAALERCPGEADPSTSPAIVPAAGGGAQLVNVRATDAIVGVTPLPFGVGDVLEDVHTLAQIRVTKIHEADNSGRGFDWENLDPDATEKTGTCPINAIGNFAPVKKPKKKSHS